MKILLHTCCGPCASACIEPLQKLGYEVVLYFSNSNIDTRAEFNKRLLSARKLAENNNLELIVDNYYHDRWLLEVAKGFENAPEKGERCARCFKYNLLKTFEYAKSHDFLYFTTSLTLSPHKVSNVIFAAAPVTHNTEPQFLKFDFKKNNGFKKSLLLSEKFELYRQNYCGCEFSKRKVSI